MNAMSRSCIVSFAVLAVSLGGALFSATQLPGQAKALAASAPEPKPPHVLSATRTVGESLSQRLARPTTVQLDSLLPYVRTLPQHEQRQQLIDLAACALVAQAAPKQEDVAATLGWSPVLRWPWLSEMTLPDYGAGRLLRLSEDEYAALLPCARSPEFRLGESDVDAEVLYRMLDSWKLRWTSVPRSLHMVRYDLGTAEPSITMQYVRTDQLSDYFSPGKHGYVRMTVMGEKELMTFLERTDLLLEVEPLPAAPDAGEPEAIERPAHRLPFVRPDRDKPWKLDLVPKTDERSFTQRYVDYLKTLDPSDIEGRSLARFKQWEAAEKQREQWRELRKNVQQDRRPDGLNIIDLGLADAPRREVRTTKSPGATLTGRRLPGTKRLGVRVEDIALLRDIYAAGGVPAGFSLDSCIDLVAFAEAVKDRKNTLPAELVELLNEFWDGKTTRRLYNPFPSRLISSDEDRRANRVFGVLYKLGAFKDEGDEGATWQGAVLRSAWKSSQRQVARYDGGRGPLTIAGTELGMTLFYCDLVMKLHSFGLSAPTPPVEGFVSGTRLSWTAQIDPQVRQSPESRLWLEPRPDEILVVSPNALRLGSCITRVSARATSQGKDVNVRPDANTEAFINSWNARYVEIADRDAQYHRFEAIMRWSAAVARYSGAQQDFWGAWSLSRVPKTANPLRFDAWCKEMHARGELAVDPPIEVVPSEASGPFRHEVIEVLRSGMFVANGQSTWQVEGGAVTADAETIGRRAFRTEHAEDRHALPGQLDVSSRGEVDRKVFNLEDRWESMEDRRRNPGRPHEREVVIETIKEGRVTLRANAPTVREGLKLFDPRLRSLTSEFLKIDSKKPLERVLEVTIGHGAEAMHLDESLSSGENRIILCRLIVGDAANQRIAMSYEPSPIMKMCAITDRVAAGLPLDGPLAGTVRRDAADASRFEVIASDRSIVELRARPGDKPALDESLYRAGRAGEAVSYEARVLNPALSTGDLEAVSAHPPYAVLMPTAVDANREQWRLEMLHAWTSPEGERVAVIKDRAGTTDTLEVTAHLTSIDDGRIVGPPEVLGALQGTLVNSKDWLGGGLFGMGRTANAPGWKFSRNSLYLRGSTREQGPSAAIDWAASVLADINLRSSDVRTLRLTDGANALIEVGDGELRIDRAMLDQALSARNGGSLFRWSMQTFTSMHAMAVDGKLPKVIVDAKLGSQVAVSELELRIGRDALTKDALKLRLLANALSGSPDARRVAEQVGPRSASDLLTIVQVQLSEVRGNLNELTRILRGKFNPADPTSMLAYRPLRVDIDWNAQDPTKVWDFLVDLGAKRLERIQTGRSVPGESWLLRSGERLDHEGSRLTALTTPARPEVSLHAPSLNTVQGRSRARSEKAREIIANARDEQGNLGIDIEVLEHDNADVALGRLREDAAKKSSRHKIIFMCNEDAAHLRELAPLIPEYIRNDRLSVTFFSSSVDIEAVALWHRAVLRTVADESAVLLGERIVGAPCDTAIAKLEHALELLKDANADEAAQHLLKFFGDDTATLFGEGDVPVSKGQLDDLIRQLQIIKAHMHTSVDATDHRHEPLPGMSNRAELRLPARSPTISRRAA